jgi:hypothetical protein
MKRCLEKHLHSMKRMQCFSKKGLNRGDSCKLVCGEKGMGVGGKGEHEKREGGGVTLKLGKLVWIP